MSIPFVVAPGSALRTRMRAALFISRVWGSNHGGCAYSQALIDQLHQLRWRVTVLAERFEQPVPDSIQLRGLFQRRPSAWLAKLSDLIQIVAFTAELGHRLIIAQGDLPRLSYLFLQELAPIIFIRQDAILTCPGNDRFLPRSHSVCRGSFGFSCLAVHRREGCMGALTPARQVCRILLRLRDRFLLRCLRHFVVNSQYLAQAHRRQAHILYPPLLVGPALPRPYVEREPGAERSSHPRPSDGRGAGGEGCILGQANPKRCSTSALQNLRHIPSPASPAPQGLGVRHDRAALDSPDEPTHPANLPYRPLLPSRDLSHPRPSDGRGAGGEGSSSSPRPSAGRGVRGEGSLRDLHRLIFCARLEPVKGADDALRVLSFLPQPYHLELLGDGPQRPELERRVRELHLDARVTFHGWVAPTTRDRWFRSAGALLMPSLWDEAFGMAGLEAFAQGTPVVAYDVGGIAEWCQASAGLLAVSGDAEGMANAVRRLTSDPDLWTTYSAAAQHIATHDFPPERFGSDLDKLLAQIAQ